MATIALGIIGGLAAIGLGMYGSVKVAIKQHNDDIDEALDILSLAEQEDSELASDVSKLKTHLKQNKISKENIDAYKEDIARKGSI